MPSAVNISHCDWTKKISLFKTRSIVSSTVFLWIIRAAFNWCTVIMVAADKVLSILKSRRNLVLKLNHPRIWVTKRKFKFQLHLQRSVLTNLVFVYYTYTVTCRYTCFQQELWMPPLSLFGHGVHVRCLHKSHANSVAISQNKKCTLALITNIFFGCAPLHFYLHSSA